MEKTETNKWLGYNQIGGRHNMSSIEPACINKMITEVHRLTKTPLCIHQYDAKGCYNRIIRNHANLNNKKFLIPDNVGKIYCEAHEIWHLKLNYITLYPKHPTPAQKSFHAVVRSKELKTQEQNRHLLVFL